MTDNNNVPSDINNLEFLTRGLLLGEGFQLYLVIVNTVDERKNLIHQLSSTEGLLLTFLEGQNLNGRGLVKAILDVSCSLQRQTERSVICISELDEIIAHEPRLLSRLNEQRNELIQNTTSAIVIIGSSQLIEQIRQIAPDVWSIRAADIEMARTTRTQYDLIKIADHKLTPIAPPETKTEYIELENHLNSLPLGDERGRVALRLAEVYNHENISPSRIAALYIEAADHISDVWLSSLARINAARSQIEAKNLDDARLSFQRIQENIVDFDYGFQAYFYFSLVNLQIITENFHEANKYAQEAIRLAHKAGDIDILAESRLVYANVLYQLGNLQPAMESAKRAEEDAMRVGNSQLAQWARTVIGKIAISIGYRQTAYTAWLRYIEQSNHVNYYNLLEVINRFDKNGEKTAAHNAWHILKKLVEEKGSLFQFIHSCLKFILDKTVWNQELFNVEIWEERLLPLQSEEIGEGTVQAWLGLAKAREALKRSDVDTASSLLDGWDNFLETQKLEDDFVQLIGWLTRASCLFMQNHQVETISYLRQKFSDKFFFQYAIAYFSTQAKKVNNINQLPIPEEVLLNFLIEWLGGAITVHKMVDLLTGGEGGKFVDSFLSTKSTKYSRLLK